jgi:hypothetical protein
MLELFATNDGLLVAGVSVASTFFLKDYLSLSAEFMATLGFGLWALGFGLWALGR